MSIHSGPRWSGQGCAVQGPWVLSEPDMAQEPSPELSLPVTSEIMLPALDLTFCFHKMGRLVPPVEMEGPTLVYENPWRTPRSGIIKSIWGNADGC